MADTADYRIQLIRLPSSILILDNQSVNLTVALKEKEKKKKPCFVLVSHCLSPSIQDEVVDSNLHIWLAEAKQPLEFKTPRWGKKGEGGKSYA